MDRGPGEEGVYYFSVDVSQAEVAALIAVGQLCVVDADSVESCVHVMHVDGFCVMLSPLLPVVMATNRPARLLNREQHAMLPHMVTSGSSCLDSLDVALSIYQTWTAIIWGRPALPFTTVVENTA